MGELKEGHLGQKVEALLQAYGQTYPGGSSYNTTSSIVCSSFSLTRSNSNITTTAAASKAAGATALQPKYPQVAAQECLQAHL
jgi:hypothetical protein